MVGVCALDSTGCMAISLIKLCIGHEYVCPALNGGMPAATRGILHILDNSLVQRSSCFMCAFARAIP